MKLCYFGLYDHGFGRNKVYLSGLKQNGVEIVECRDTSSGPVKFWKLWRKHAAIVKAGGYDALIVGYPGHLVVPFAKLLSDKPVIFDALCTLYEGEVISRGKYRFNPFMNVWIRLVDRLAAKSADLILVETNAQRDYFINKFSLPESKVHRIFTGCAEDEYHPESGISKRAKFTAIFRGKFLPEAGVGYIIQAAKALEHSGVDFLVVGNGFLENDVGALIHKLKPSNLEWVREHLPADVLRKKLLECHVSLGQFERHERLERTIPHKAFETLALGLPYITGRSGGISELLTDGKDCLMVNLADSEDLAVKVLRLKNDPELAKDLGANGRRLYENALTPRILAKEIIQSVQGLLAQK